MIPTGHDLSEAEIARGYDALAHDFVMPPYFYPEVVQFIGRVEGLRILDCGCGSGELLLLLATKGGKELHGLEISPGLCAVTQSKLGERAMIHRSSLQARWPFEAGTFDLIVMTEVMEHLAHPDVALREARRVLAGDGRLVVTFPNASAYEPFLDLAHRRDGKGRWWAFLPWEHPRKTAQPIDTVYTYEEIQRLLEEANWAVRRMHGREALPFLWDWASIEPWRALRAVLRSLVRLRPTVDQRLNRLGKLRRCYRLFVECRPAP
ncbi:MAG: methyltransferase domain-containing protein [Candidatus Methylomirabilota bacterium]